MIEVLCINKYRDTSGRISGYAVQDNQGNVKLVETNQLKKAIINNQIRVVNLKLTSDGRLIDDRIRPEGEQPKEDILDEGELNYNIDAFVDTVIQKGLKKVAEYPVYARLSNLNKKTNIITVTYTKGTNIKFSLAYTVKASSSNAGHAIFDIAVKPVQLSCRNQKMSLVDKLPTINSLGKYVRENDTKFYSRNKLGFNRRYNAFLLEPPKSAYYQQSRKDAAELIIIGLSLVIVKSLEELKKMIEDAFEIKYKNLDDYPRLRAAKETVENVGNAILELTEIFLDGMAVFAAIDGFG